MHSTPSRVNRPSAVVPPALTPSVSSAWCEQLVAAEEEAGDAGADVDEVAAALVALEHLVEAGRAEHLGRRDAGELGDVLHGVVGEVAVLLLGQVAAAG